MLAILCGSCSCADKNNNIDLVHGNIQPYLYTLSDFPFFFFDMHVEAPAHKHIDNIFAVSTNRILYTLTTDINCALPNICLVGSNCR